MTKPSAELVAALAKVFDGFHESDNGSLPDGALRNDFVFHMTDWLNDFRDLHRLYENPTTASAEAAESVVFGFLVHALPHLRAAGRMLLGRDVPDPFPAESAAASGRPTELSSR